MGVESLREMGAHPRLNPQQRVVGGDEEKWAGDRPGNPDFRFDGLGKPRSR